MRARTVPAVVLGAVLVWSAGAGASDFDWDEFLASVDPRWHGSPGSSNRTRGRKPSAARIAAISIQKSVGGLMRMTRPQKSGTWWLP